VFRLTGVVVLPGIEAPSAARAPFIMRPFDQELLLCQRYYEKSYDYNVALGSVSSNGCVHFVGIAAPTGGLAIALYSSFAVRKRASPLMTWYSPATGASGKLRGIILAVDVAANTLAIGEHGSNVYGNVPATESQLQGHWTADARF
jgi:hypothetical protein